MDSYGFLWILMDSYGFFGIFWDYLKILVASCEFLRILWRILLGKPVKKIPGNGSCITRRSNEMHGNADKGKKERVGGASRRLDVFEVVSCHVTCCAPY